MAVHASCTGSYAYEAEATRGARRLGVARKEAELDQGLDEDARVPGTAAEPVQSLRAAPRGVDRPRGRDRRGFLVRIAREPEVRVQKRRRREPPERPDAAFVARGIEGVALAAQGYVQVAVRRAGDGDADARRARRGVAHFHEPIHAAHAVLRARDEHHRNAHRARRALEPLPREREVADGGRERDDGARRAGPFPFRLVRRVQRHGAARAEPRERDAFGVDGAVQGRGKRDVRVRRPERAEPDEVRGGVRREGEKTRKHAPLGHRRGVLRARE